MFKSRSKETNRLNPKSREQNNTIQKLVGKRDANKKKMESTSWLFEITINTDITWYNSSRN